MAVGTVVLSALALRNTYAKRSVEDTPTAILTDELPACFATHLYVANAPTVAVRKDSLIQRHLTIDLS